MKYSILSILLLVGYTSCTSQTIEVAKIKQHIKILANDSIQGRSTGSEGEKMAAAYVQSEFKKMKLTVKGDEKSYLQSFPFKSGMHGTGTEGIANNIVAYIDNKAANTIIIGAHYDHLGLGNDGSSLDANPQGKIHNGADDNASGTAGVIELARYFQTNNVKEKNNFLFLCFSGEELGLFGSKYFTENPTIDINKVTYMINMDMIGRLDPTTNSIAVSGTGTSPVWEPLLQKLSSDKLQIKTDSAGMGPSDHSSFYLKNIPVLHFFTGSHSDYHKPSDDWDKINYSGEVAVLNLIVQVIKELENEPKLQFLTTKNKAMASARSFKVTLGVMPSYTSDASGLKIDGVTEGKPAQLAGIQAGDVVIQMGDLEIKDIQNYMDALTKFEKGEKTTVKVKRNNEVLTFIVTF